MRICCVRGALRGMLLCAMLVAGPSWAAAKLEDELGQVASRLKDFLDKRGETAVALGEFTPPPGLPGGAGPAIKQFLRDKLTALGVTITRTAKLGIEGKYRFIDDKDSGQARAELTTLIMETSSTKPLLDVVHPITDAAEMGRLGGLSAGSNHLQGGKAGAGIQNAQPFFNGTRVRGQAGSPYAVEIQVGPTSDGPFQPRRPRDDDGLAYVSIKRGEFYRIHVINESPSHVAARVTVDGLNIFTFAEIKNERTGQPMTTVFVKPGETLPVRGWVRNFTESWAFEVAAFEKSAAAEVGHSDGVGTITVTFAPARFGRAEPVPAEAPPRLQVFPKASPSPSRGVPTVTAPTEVIGGAGTIGQPAASTVTELGSPKGDAQSPQSGGIPRDATARGAPVGARYTAAVDYVLGDVQAIVSIRYTR